jgi:hypothetical protein
MSWQAAMASIERNQAPEKPSIGRCAATGAATGALTAIVYNLFGSRPRA